MSFTTTTVHLRSDGANVIACQSNPTREVDSGVQVFLMKYTKDSTLTRNSIAYLQCYRKMLQKIQLSDENLLMDVSQF